MILLADITHHLSMIWGSSGRYVLLAVGLGFVVFFHELGHFLSAKYCGVLVEQFSLGFGPAIVAWRKGVGFHRGTTTPEMEKRVEAYLRPREFAGGEYNPTAKQIAAAQSALGLGETEYRLNWLPLGGYVKMLGQDDLHAGADSNDPRAFNNKPIPARMLIISAGVLMNILLAGIGFMIVFLIGFRSAPAEIGGVVDGSPADFATRDDGSRQPLQVGDRILDFDGKPQHNFAEVSLTVALAKEGESLPITVQHPDGTIEHLHVTPQRPAGEGMLQIGVMPPFELRGLDSSDPSDQIDEDLSDRKLFSADVEAVKPGETITAINGRPVGSYDDYAALYDALADSDGNPVTLQVRAVDGTTRREQVSPHFEAPFADENLAFAGMVPEARVAMVTPKSPAYGVIHPGDVIAVLAPAPGSAVAEIDNPPPQQLRDAINAAGQEGAKVVLKLIDSAGVARQTAPIDPNAPIPPDRRGLGVVLGCDERSTVISAVEPGSAADRAGIKPGWRITQLAGQPVSNWFQVRRILAAATPDMPIPIETVALADSATTQPATTQPAISQSVKAELVPSAREIAAARFMTFTTDLNAVLRQQTELRKTTSPIVAAEWGAAETRDFILQFYVTLHRMIGGSVSYKEAMGPVGIVRAGAMSAARGPDWLIWFLAMISANLAVANFLPIPVMDGGLFVLLILEAFQGRPLAPKTQQVIQTIGLALILGIFVLLTYQDITRNFGHG